MAIRSSIARSLKLALYDSHWRNYTRVALKRQVRPQRAVALPFVFLPLALLLPFKFILLPSYFAGHGVFVLRRLRRGPIVLVLQI